MGTLNDYFVSRQEFSAAKKAIEQAKKVIKDAEKITEKYLDQNPVIKELMVKQECDIDLLTCTSNATRNWLERYNETCEEGQEIIYVSDIIDYILECGIGASVKTQTYRLWFLARFGGCGEVKLKEILKHVIPFLEGKKVPVAVRVPTENGRWEWHLKLHTFGDFNALKAIEEEGGVIEKY